LDYKKIWGTGKECSSNPDRVLNNASRRKTETKLFIYKNENQVTTRLNGNRGVRR